MWEELLIFNENYDYFIQEDPSVIMFFEVSSIYMLVHDILGPTLVVLHWNPIIHFCSQAVYVCVCVCVC